jgi:hypothetical protein
MVDAYIAVLELDFFELKEAFGGLKDENIWKRPAAGLLSVGELAGHIAYWFAGRLASEGDGTGHPDLSKCKVQSLLIDRRFSYYPNTIPSKPSDEHLAMSAEQVLGELLRIHQESIVALRTSNPDLDSPVPGYQSFWTWRETLKYQCFHVAYHIGQMYSVRHCLGEETPDN